MNQLLRLLQHTYLDALYHNLARIELYPRSAHRTEPHRGQLESQQFFPGTLVADRDVDLQCAIPVHLSVQPHYRDTDKKILLSQFSSTTHRRYLIDFI
ncbi:hypothetical protein [Argonema antarcticum]|uniref:hypothetical protein n=1 Tax=Argonema antarcticum TaxID=2942763 RepID=UPI002011D8BA|nr:hypothetical protein [Argonema antarcticum]MCL1473363.1 hypothetical protein [Argonema antarcticum A004/B2]